MSAVLPSQAPDAQRRRRARAAVEGVARVTPVLRSEGLTDRFGAPVVLKAESLQRTGSFKIRGALAKLAALGEGAARGVVAGSAGNHARAVAEAARTTGIPASVFMPAGAPIAKIEACRRLGADVVLVDGPLENALAAAHDLADERGMAFLHPFDDADVVAGQGTIGEELLDQVPDMAQIVVPVGGGGLICGIATAVKAARPDVRIVGVRAALHGSVVAARESRSPVSSFGDGLWERSDAPTIADGISVKRPGDLTGPLVEALVDDVVAVDEDSIAEAMVLLLDRVNLVVEGAGAVGLAALLRELVPAPDAGSTVLLLSGGNVDTGLLAQIARRHESLVGRRLVLNALVPDRPGSLVRLLTGIADAGASVTEIQHVREGVDLHVGDTAVRLTLETRGRDHADQVIARVREQGFPVERSA
ncbi:threonine ammonia-lyase [Patulibacter sp. SYSU D01012]|uniref:threonine ammonia-lyase n=1 Tax=Patulibacter sp. SYSU D01012 TaxID=2817381 RepID=UPI001B30890E|nr:threonine ammonia-lyase [Patulibacter sp. SYSU D01012]